MKLEATEIESAESKRLRDLGCDLDLLGINDDVAALPRKTPSPNPQISQEGFYVKLINVKYDDVFHTGVQRVARSLADLPLPRKENQDYQVKEHKKLCQVRKKKSNFRSQIF